MAEKESALTTKDTKVHEGQTTKNMRTLRALLISICICIAPCAAVFGQSRQDADLIVSGGIIVTMDGVRTILQDGSVAIKGDDDCGGWTGRRD